MPRGRAARRDSKSPEGRPAMAGETRASFAGRLGRGRAALEGGGVFDAEVFVDLSRRVRTVERVEMDSAHLVVEQVAALLGRPVDADLGDGLGIVATALDRPVQPGGDPRSQGE